MISERTIFMAIPGEEISCRIDFTLHGTDSCWRLFMGTKRGIKVVVATDTPMFSKVIFHELSSVNNSIEPNALALKICPPWVII